MQNKKIVTLEIGENIKEVLVEIIKSPEITPATKDSIIRFLLTPKFILNR